MILEENILDKFISPNNSNRQATELLIQKITHQLLDFLSTASERPTNPTREYRNTSHFTIPEFSQSQTAILPGLHDLYKSSMNPANPKYIGHMDSMSTLWSVIGDFIASALNNNMLSLEMSPFITQMEYSLTKQFAELFGLPGTAGGSGIDKADSISFSPQKWMYEAKTCSMVLFRDFNKMVEHFRIPAPYMKNQSEYINLGEINVQGSKCVYSTYFLLPTN